MQEQNLIAIRINRNTAFFDFPSIKKLNEFMEQIQKIKNVEYSIIINPLTKKEF